MCADDFAPLLIEFQQSGTMFANNPDPMSVLFVTRITQREFCTINALILSTTNHTRFRIYRGYDNHRYYTLSYIVPRLWHNLQTMYRKLINAMKKEYAQPYSPMLICEL